MTHWTTADMPDQSERVAVVTGANSGLGYHVALALAMAGADVLLACRNIAKAESAAASIRKVVPAASVRFMRLDLADLASVEAFANNFRSENDRLDLLVNNAGLMAVDQSRTVDGFQTQLAILLFTAELQRRLAEAGARAIAVAAHPGVARTNLGSQGHGISNGLIPCPWEPRFVRATPGWAATAIARAPASARRRCNSAVNSKMASLLWQ